MGSFSRKLRSLAVLFIVLLGCSSCSSSGLSTISTTTIPTVAVENAGWFSVSQSGQLYFFRRTNDSQSDKWRLFTVMPGGKPEPILADQAFLPGNIIWAPDGQAVYFFDALSNKQWVIHFSGEIQIHELSGAFFRAWAPSADRFLAVSTDPSGQASLVTYDADCNQISTLNREIEALQKLFQSIGKSPDMKYQLNYNDIDARWVKDCLVLVLHVESTSSSWTGRAIVQLDLLNMKTCVVSQGLWDLLLPSPSGEYFFLGVGAPSSEKGSNGSWLISGDGREWQISEYKVKKRAAWSEDGSFLYYFEPLWAGSLKSAPDDGDRAFSHLKWQLIRFDPRTQQKNALYTNLPLAGEPLVRDDRIYFLSDESRILALPLFP